jgi:hypothetical protein
MSFNSAIHNVNKRNIDYLHEPVDNLSCFKSTEYAIDLLSLHKICINLPLKFNNKERRKK